MFVDHAFILCDVGAPEADALLARGFVEGSRNVHPGQGTANRRFFFANFMLELIWVADLGEVASPLVQPTGLWERWCCRNDDASRFGLVFGGESADTKFATQPYRPAYLPRAMSLDVVRGLALAEPAMFWMRWLSDKRPRSAEPADHAVPIREVTGLAIGVPNPEGLSVAARAAGDAGLVRFFEARESVLEIEFPSSELQVIDCRPTLPLIFRGVG
jgi:glyoxalase-like protein